MMNPFDLHQESPSRYMTWISNLLSIEGDQDAHFDPLCDRRSSHMLSGLDHLNSIRETPKSKL